MATARLYTIDLVVIAVASMGLEYHHEILKNEKISEMCFSHGLLLHGLFTKIAAAFLTNRSVKRFFKIRLAKVLSFELRQVHFNLN